MTARLTGLKRPSDVKLLTIIISETVKWNVTYKVLSTLYGTEVLPVHDKI